MSLLHQLILFFSFFLLLQQNDAQTTPSNQDDQIMFSVKNYKDTDTVPIAKRLNLAPNSTQLIKIIDAPKTISFVVVQTHSFLHNVRLSYLRDLTPQSYVEGTNIGLVLDLNDPKVLGIYLENINSFNVSSLVSVVPYSNSVPVPGGCNMEFSTSIAPYLQVKYDKGTVTVDGQPARPPLSSNSGDVCSGTNMDISYRMYHTFMTEHDFSENSYFAALESMITPSAIETNGHQIFNSPSLPILRHIYSAYEGVGSVFGLIAVAGDSNKSAYVPTMTYACGDLNDCGPPPTIRIFAGCLILVGVFLCFGSQFILKLEIFILNTMLVIIILYILAVADVVALEMGSFIWAIVGSITLSWMVHKMCCCSFCWIPLLYVIIPLILFGGLITSVLFFAIEDFFISLENDTFFWLLFLCCVMLVILITITSFTLAFSNVIASAVVGGYLVVLGLDFLSGTILKYILLNPIYRAGIDGFNMARTGPPFQTPDGILVIAWAIITGCGIFVQKLKMKKGMFEEVNARETTPLLGSHSGF